jgi:ABC-type microcin C transport system permease subunit YejB
MESELGGRASISAPASSTSYGGLACHAHSHIFASLKIAITLAFVGAVISETVASNQGIGYLMISASSTFRVPLVFAALLVIAAMGVACTLSHLYSSVATPDGRSEILKGGFGSGG